MSDSVINQLNSRRLAVFTICSNNYMPFARVLLDSVNQHHPDADTFVALADEVVEWDGLYEGTFKLIEARDLGIPGFRNFAFRYDIMEFNTAIKPFVFLHLMQQLQYDDIIYFDPDIQVYAPLSAVLGPLAGGASFVLTPHLHRPAEGDADPDDLAIMRAGIYNLGFLGASRTEETLGILRWWARRLRFQCVNQQGDGLFTDQKFMDLVPGFAPHTHISHDTSLNVAYWNVGQVSLSGTANTVLVDGRPLTFFHFSGFDAQNTSRLSKHTRHHAATTEGEGLPQPLQGLMENYAARLLADGYGRVPASLYAYGRFASGVPIHTLLRRMFRETMLDWPDDPFETYEAHLHRAAPVGNHDSARFIVTNLLHYLWSNSPFLSARMDLNTASGVQDLTNWYLKQARRELGFDPRLIEPVAERAGYHRFPNRAPLPSGAKRADVSVVAYLKTTSGVGEVGRHTLRSLARSGLAVEGMDVSLGVISSRDEVSCDNLLVDRATGRVQIFANINADQLPTVLVGLAERLVQPAYRISMPAWELEEFPDAWLPAFDQVDEIWAQSAWVQTMLVRKLTKPVLRMPIALTLPHVHPASRQEFGLPDDAFLFYTSFDFLSFMERKNPAGALGAFRKAFPAPRGDKVGLVVKTMNGARFPDQLAALQDLIGGDPRIHFIDAVLPRDQMLGLLAACDAALSLHRCEGLGLLVAEGMALGKPVIATDYGATTELVTDRTGYQVDYCLKPVGNGEYPMSDGQVWADPDLEHGAWQMRRVVSNVGDRQSRVAAAAAHLRQGYSPEVVLARQRKRLAELAVQ